MKTWKTVMLMLLTSTILNQSLLSSYSLEGEKGNCQAPLNILSQGSMTAAGILHYTLHDDQIHVLLGRRDDSQSRNGDWCNFGGGSEIYSFPTSQSHSTLAQDAARESCEESNGIYAPHYLNLQHQPFIDILTQKNNFPFLYRMYWQQVQYVDAAIFKQKLDNAKLKHNQEYTQFVWVKASEIFLAVKYKNPLLKVEQTLINIYGPLFKTLSTASGSAFLNKLSSDKTLKTIIKKEEGKNIYSSIRSYLNKCYDLEGKRLFNRFFPLPTKHPIVEVPSAFNPLLSLNNHETTRLNNEQEVATLARAVAAHGMAMVELKKLFLTDKFQSEIKRLRITGTQEKEEAPLDINPLWNSQCDETISRIHLRIVLGPAYKTPDYFSYTQNPQRQADLANIKTYFNDYKPVVEQLLKSTHSKKDGFKRNINILDSDYEFLADALAFEAQNKQWPTFYHGTSENINNLFRSYTYLRELISLQPLEGLVALRGTDIYFKNMGTVRDLLKQTGDCESDKTKRAMMFLNFALFADLKTTASTSSSVEYILNNHSVAEPELIHTFQESLVLAGFLKPKYDYFQSLFEQYLKHKQSPFGNSVLIAISQTPKNIDDYNYASEGGGGFNSISSTLQILHNIQAEYGRQKKSGFEKFDSDYSRKKNLFPENRLLLHPARVMDSFQTHIKAFDRFPLSKRDQHNYDQEMRQTTVSMLTEWLIQNTAVSNGNFIQYPALLKKLYEVVYKGVTGEILKESQNADGFIHLLGDNYLDAIQEYLENYPNVFEQVDLNAKNHYGKIPLVWAMENRHTEIVKILIAVPKVDLNVKDHHGSTVLSWAMDNNDPEIVKKLITTNKVDVNVKNSFGFTTLAWAAKEGHTKIVKKLIATSKVDLNLKDHLGDTPLSYAISKGHIEIVKMLIDNTQVDLNAPNNYGITPLSATMSENYTEIMKILIHSGKVDFTVKKYGETPLLWAAKKGYKEIVEMLINTGNVDLNDTDSFKNTPLDLAVKYDHTEIVKMLSEFENSRKEKGKKIKEISMKYSFSSDSYNAFQAGAQSSIQSYQEIIFHNQKLLSLVETYEQGNFCSEIGIDMVPSSWLYPFAVNEYKLSSPYAHFTKESVFDGKEAFFATEIFKERKRKEFNDKIDLAKISLSEIKSNILSIKDLSEKK